MPSKKGEEDISLAMRKMKYLGTYVQKYFFDKGKNLVQHIQDINNQNFEKIHLERQKEYKKLIAQKIKFLFRDTYLRDFKFDQEKGLTLNITDHHGLINQPIFYSANIVSDFNRLFLKKKNNFPIITLNCGNCPLDEWTHKRGFKFRGKNISLFPKKEKSHLVYATAKRQFDIVSRVIKSKKHILFNKDEMGFLERIDDILSKIDYSKCKKYSDQATKINKEIWPLLFEKKIRNNVIDLIGLEHDEILVKFLGKFLNNKDTFIHQMLFDNKFGTHILNKFRGLFGAWNEKINYGTHFFWHIDKNGIQHRMYINSKNELEARNGFKIKLSLEEVLENLSKKTILPGIFLKFSVSTFYLGIKPLGGISSLNYLSNLKTRWLESMPNKFKRETKLIGAVNTDTLVAIPIAYYLENSKVKNLYAFDAIYRGGIKKDYLKKLSEELSIADLTKPLIVSYNHFRTFLPGRNKKIDFDENLLYQPIEKVLLSLKN